MLIKADEMNQIGWARSTLHKPTTKVFSLPKYYALVSLLDMIPQPAIYNGATRMYLFLRDMVSIEADWQIGAVNSLRGDRELKIRIWNSQWK